MTSRRRFRLTLEDESRIENIFRFSVSSFKFLTAGVVFILLLMIIGALLMAFTPVKKILPGYLTKDERMEVEMQYLRLDSMLSVLEAKEIYLSSILNILNDKSPSPSIIDKNAEASPYINDTLINISEEENLFLEQMREREKYDISVVAPLAAESLMFSPVSELSVISEKTKTSRLAEVILAKDATIDAIADGTVILITKEPGNSGNTLILQHSKGFVSKYGRLDDIIVEEGQKVNAGDVLAFQASRGAKLRSNITIEMWHNGNPLIPNEYIGEDDVYVHRPIVDEEVGRGRL